MSTTSDTRLLDDVLFCYYLYSILRVYKSAGLLSDVVTMVDCEYFVEVYYTRPSGGRGRFGSW